MPRRRAVSTPTRLVPAPHAHRGPAGSGRLAWRTTRCQPRAWITQFRRIIDSMLLRRRPRKSTMPMLERNSSGFSSITMPGGRWTQRHSTHTLHCAGRLATHRVVPCRVAPTMARPGTPLPSGKTSVYPCTNRSAARSPSERTTLAACRWSGDDAGSGREPCRVCGHPAPYSGQCSGHGPKTEKSRGEALPPGGAGATDEPAADGLSVMRKQQGDDEEGGRGTCGASSRGRCELLSISARLARAAHGQALSLTKPP